MAMDVKDLRTETALSERNNDGSKYTQGGVALQCNRNKSYQDIGSNPLAKTEPTPVRPCAVIGPDRVVPPHASNDAFLKKGPVEPWPGPGPNNIYRRPPEYPHKISSSQNPSRNISPRQTFQENMQRIMVPPTYNTVRHSDDANFNHIPDRNVTLSKKIKTNVAPEPKYCDVPYAINNLTNEPKNIRDAEIYVPSVNSPLTQTAPHGWPPGSVNVHPPRTYGAHELYQYPQYPSCAGQRPTVIPMTRPHRTIQEDPAYVYPDHYYQDPSVRFKPYPPMKERYPQPRYEYIGNYPNQFHPPPPLQPQKFDISKSGQSHPYPVYPHLKYMDNRVPDPTIEGYQRATNQQPHYNIQFRNQVIHPTYAPVPGSISQNKMHPYLPDASVKSVASNKLHYDNSSKMYIDYENARTKTYPMAESYFVNEMGRVQPVKNQMVMPNYSSIGMHSIPTQQYYRKDNSIMKPFDYMPHFRNFEPPMNTNAMLRHAPQFSPNTLAISPTDSVTSNDTSQLHGTSQEDCGYASQSSTASVRSVDSGIYRLPHEFYKRYDYRYGPIVGSSPTLTRSDINSNSSNSKDNKQKQIDVRQFLQMWNEGEEENNCENNNSKEIVIQTGSSDTSNFQKQHASNQDQLYVLGLVNVPSEELGKYEHIQKISKLPENIKGYNSLELLSQFEEAIESSNTTSFKSINKEYQMPAKDNLSKQLVESLQRPVSPLDVEAKISQSVIHKEVGCNFEIRPCSPKMLNVEVAAPAQNILGERVIEKVTNPLSKIIKSPKPIISEENSNCHTIKRQENTFAINENPSCKMTRSPYSTNNMDSVKTNYTLQDLEINSGVCLASLPRLDNEIELNFPEVNQQFINANKKDGSSTVKNCRRNNLEKETVLSDSKLIKADTENSENPVMVENTEKMFTKLSKFRKLKTNPADHSEKNQLTKAVRTDSVIIKNPENIKNIEDKLLESNHNVPINLSSQMTVSLDSPDKLNENNESDVDIALDFSLNKSSNDLPIIDMEKDEVSKTLVKSLTHVTCENVVLADPSKSCDKNTNFNENMTCDSKDATPKSIETESSTDNCIENNQDSRKDAEANFNEDAIKSSIMNNDTHTFVSTSPCSDNLLSESIPPSNKRFNIDYDTNHVNTNHKEKSENLQCKDNISSNDHKWVKEYKDTMMTNHSICNEDNAEKDFKNRSNVVLAHTEIVPDYKENEEMMQLLSPENVVTITTNDVNGNKKTPAEEFINRSNLIPSHTEIVSEYEESGEIMHLLSPEIESNNLTIENDVNKSKHVMLCSHSKIDFVHDEISASLEKLFQDSNEDTVLSSSENDSSHNMTVSMPMKTPFFRQSKELYSPWIQKLLTHSEGLCFYSGRESIKKRSIESISTDSKYNITNHEHFNTDILRIEQSQNMDIEEDNETTDSLVHTKANEMFVKKTPEDLIDATCKFTTNIQLETIKDMNVFLSQKKNKPQDIIQTLSEENDISNANKLCIQKSKEWFLDENIKVNSELDVKRKNYANDCELDTFQDSKSTKELFDCGAVISSSIESIENESETTSCETTTAGEASKIFESEPKNIIEEDWSNSSENVSNSVSNSCKSSDTEVVLETFDCSNIDRQFDDIIQTDFNKPSLDTLANNASENCIQQQKENNENVTEHELKIRDNDKDETSETFDDRNNVYKLNNMVQENFNNPYIENLSEPDSGGCTGHETEKHENEEKMFENAIKISDSDKNETSDRFDSTKIVCKFDNMVQEDIISNKRILETLSNRDSDSSICTRHLTEENKFENILIKNMIKSHNSDGGETSEILIDSSDDVCKFDIIVQEDLNKSSLECSSSSVTDYCTGFKEEKNLNEELLIENVNKDRNSDKDETSEKKYKSNICKLDNKVQEDWNLQSMSDSVSDNCSEHQKKYTQSGKILIESVVDIHTSDQYDAPEPSTSSNIVCKFGNVDQEECSTLNQEILSNSFSDICTGCEARDNRREDIHIENKNVITDTHSKNLCNTSKNNDEPNILIQENGSNLILESIPNCVSDRWTEHKIEINSSSKETNIEVANDKVIILPRICDNNLDSLSSQVLENYQVQLENHAANSDKEISIEESLVQRRLSLKRSFSDSALNKYRSKDGNAIENTPNWSSKRQRMYELEHCEEHVIGENVCNFIQNNRRNSVSSFYNEENVSFCILIENNCIITEDSEEEKICFAEIAEDCITEIRTTNEEDNVGEIICCSQENQLHLTESDYDYENDKSIQESWLDDVACVETVVSDDVEEDFITSAHVSPRDVEGSEYDKSGIFNCNMSLHTEYVNEETTPDDVSKILETYRSPHINSNVMLCDKEPQDTEFSNDFYEGKCLEKIHSGSNSRECSPSLTSDFTESILLPDDTTNSKMPEDKENIFVENITLQDYENYTDNNSVNRRNDENYFSVDINQTETSCIITHDDAVQSCESSMDNMFNYKEEGEKMYYTTSSSPEVSSTTSEEKSSSILLKITNYNGSRVSEINEINHNRPRCKFTEEKEYSNPTGSFPKRPLITKAAQKYIPPLKESIRDLKIKLSLPQQRLLKLKQLKLSRTEPKINKHNNTISTIPKKPKPNFEDVLKNIDEVQIKMHKEKSKKAKNIVPKVVIKKNVNGSHYTSSSNKDSFNPDLTGRKWQPWVFLEKNHLVDKMAIRNKTKAIFSHRKNTYVLAEKFKKYKSVTNCSPNFVISQPKTGDSSKGKLKYTIRLKHTYS